MKLLAGFLPECVFISSIRGVYFPVAKGDEQYSPARIAGYNPNIPNVAESDEPKRTLFDAYSVGLKNIRSHRVSTRRLYPMLYCFSPLANSAEINERLR